MSKDYSFNGLSAEQVKSRIEAGKVNRSENSTGKTVKQIILSNTLTYFNFIFAVITVLLCIAGSFRNLTFLPIVIGNALVGIFQELRAKKTLDKMSLLNAPHANVIRDGQLLKIKSEHLVADDIVVFRAGDQICADAIVLEGSASVNEALLTGEQDEIPKTPGERLLSGSFVTSGECVARLERVGNESYISRLALEAKAADDREQSEMIKAINKIVMWMGIIIIPIGGLLFYQSFYVSKAGFSASVVSAVAAVIGMIPEGLYLLTTAALALGTIRLAKRKVLLNDMKSIESLARVDVLCVDKTGTITEPSMQVREFIVLDDDVFDGAENMLARYAAASKDTNATMEALKKYTAKISPPSAVEVTAVVPFSSSVKYGAVDFKGGSLVLGAPDFVLESMEKGLKKQIDEFSSKGYRVLVFAFQNEGVSKNGLSEGIRPVGLLTLSNAVRKNAPATFKYFAEQGVDIKVISGDKAETVSEVARLAGINNYESFVDASFLDTEQKLFDAAEKYTVFGRVTPKQKQQLVNALKAKKHTVAMTGDGVNDILAMKDADCGIAMASGSEAVSQAANLVLLDSDFAKMPGVVSEGRRVVNNIERSASLFLVKNIFSLLLSVIAVLLTMNYPLEPSHISLISMFTIGIPGFLLALESNNSKIEGHFLKNVLLRALPAGITDAFIVASLTFSGQLFGISRSDVSTSATIVLSVVGFMIVHRISRPQTLYRRCVLILNIVGMIACFLFVPNLFSIVSLPANIIQLVIIYSLAAESLLRIVTAVMGLQKDEPSEKKRKKKVAKHRKSSTM